MARTWTDWAKCAGAMLCLAAGTGILGQSVAELEQRAARGDADAEFRLGVEYAAGRDGPADMAQALAWYRRAAAQGNVNAM